MEGRRAAKVGVAGKVYQKLEDNVNRETASGMLAAIAKLINDACAELDGFEPVPGDDWKKMSDRLIDGVVLCKFINQLLKADGKPPVKFQMKANSTFQKLANVDAFTNGALAYGVLEESTFQSGDLCEGLKGQFFNVMNCLNSIGFQANKKGAPWKYGGNLKKD